ncbi:homocysteine S-methyltransferase [Nocardioides sp. CER19]|uniref:homocysteine S-methyltransferase n=1 Tax=Nocardioides sp. CER19 TaxID=3038538 RepID=UPI0024495B08|nr:homocysteine S-methyltransferase [Nocardioides sp. CER19]MDH2416687.1 homocysteine S-methyltransferase [Nocardioides sp. CER19]
MPVPTLDSPLVLDGGLSNALEDRGHRLVEPLWTARLLRDDPAEIKAVHRSYFAAGARVAITASYQATLPGLVGAGLSPREAAGLIRLSVRLAREAAAELAGDGVTRYVAASVGPYGAFLADGSEYRGRYGLDRADLRDFHAPRLELLAGERPDLIAVETIPDVDEVEVLVDLLDELGLPAWVSLAVADGRTRAGQSLDDAFAAAASGRSIVAVGVNCCDPTEAGAAVGRAALTGLPVVCYPNSGEGWQAADAPGGVGHWTGRPTYDVSAATDWVATGARLVGGCCRVGQDQIAALAEALA